MYRARIVTRDFEQEQGIDYDETFEPIVWWNTLRLLIATAVQRKWRIIKLDVKTTFLYGILHKEVYKFQPKGFVLKGSESKVCLLRKALYGLIQEALTWNETIRLSEVRGFQEVVMIPIFTCQLNQI